MRCGFLLVVEVVVSERDKSAAELALDAIAEACGCAEWEYPGQVVRDVLAVVRERDGAVQHMIVVEQQNVALLRWQSVVADAHIDHLCALVRSLAVADETPRSLRDLSAMGVEEEIRRAVCAERINRAKSEEAAAKSRMSAEAMECRALASEMDVSRLSNRITKMEALLDDGISIVMDFAPGHDVWLGAAAAALANVDDGGGERD